MPPFSFRHVLVFCVSLLVLPASQRPALAGLIVVRYEGPGVEVIPPTSNAFPIEASFQLEDTLFGVVQPAQGLTFQVAGFTQDSTFFPARNEIATDAFGNIQTVDILLGGVDESLRMTSSDWEYAVQGILDLTPQRQIESTSAPAITIVPEPSSTMQLSVCIATAFVLRRRSRQRHTNSVA